LRLPYCWKANECGNEYAENLIRFVSKADAIEVVVNTSVHVVSRNMLDNL